MSLEVSLVQEFEIPAFTHLECLSFHAGIGALLTGPATPSNESALSKGHLDILHNDPTARFLKVVDLSTGEMIAGAKWNLYPHGNSEEDLEKIFDRSDITDPRHKRIFDEYLDPSRREIMGTKPHYILQLLFTHPEHYRRGAGAMLIRWATQMADGLGLECYVESSIDGRNLYEREGFVGVKEKKFEMEEFGREDLGIDINCIMVRPPRIIE
jgi:GNAT superfamily N-acetyltransferase